LLNRASQGGGFVAVSWRSTFLDYLFSWNATWSDFAHGVYVGALSARTFRSSDATALRAEMLPPGPPPDGPRRGVSGVELARVRLRAPGRLGVDGADDWMGGARLIVVDPETGAISYNADSPDEGADGDSPSDLAQVDVEVDVAAYSPAESMKMNLTSMKRSTLPDEAAHLNGKTVSSDWRREYPLAGASTWGSTSTTTTTSAEAGFWFFYSWNWPGSSGGRAMAMAAPTAVVVPTMAFLVQMPCM